MEPDNHHRCSPSSPSANCASKVALSFDSGMGGDSEVAGEGIVMDVWRGSGSNARYLRQAAERTKRHTVMPCIHFRRAGDSPDTASAPPGRREVSAIPAGPVEWNPDRGPPLDRKSTSLD